MAGAYSSSHPDAQASTSSAGHRLQEPSDDAESWKLLCACTLSEVDPHLLGARAEAIACELFDDPGFRWLEPEAAAYLWVLEHVYR
ncbi:MAG: hypothetical protein RLZZ618_2672 [Pseudomonadota bacterium]|jgi:hypothetical protein